MTKRKRNKTEHAPNGTQHAFEHLSKNEFLAAISGDLIPPKPPAQTEHKGHFTQLPTDHGSGDSRKRRRRDSIAPSKDVSSSKRVEVRAVEPLSTLETLKKGNYAKTSHIRLSGKETPSKSRVNGTPINSFSVQAVRSRFSISHDSPSEAVSTTSPRPRRAQPQSFQLLGDPQQNKLPNLFRSSRGDLDIKVVPGTPMASTPKRSSSQQLDRYHTPGFTSGSESEDSHSTPSSRSGRRTPCTPGRSPYVQNVERPPLETFIPNQHESRQFFRERAERKRSERTEEDIKVKGGMLVPSERERLAAHCAAYQQSHRMNDHDFAEFIQSRSAETHILLGKLHDLIPYRRRKTISDYMRRNFHNFKPRGQWTQEEDEKLAEMVSRLGHRWILIASEMNRHNEDCSERYKNYHYVKNQKLTRWDDTESDLLRNAVGSAILAAVKQGAKDIRQHHSRADGVVDPSEWIVTENEASKLLMWQTVASSVPRRSRLQCYMRWGLLRKHGASSYVWELARAMKREGYTRHVVNGVHIRPQGKAMDAPQGIRINARDDPQNLGKTVCSIRIKEMYGGDKLDLIRIIKDSRTKRDEEIDWDGIRRDNPGLKMFTDMMLAGEWEAAKAKYETAKSKSLQGLKTRKAARKVGEWLESTMENADKSRRWTTLKNKPNPTNRSVSKSPRKPYKSSKYVDVEDRVEPGPENHDFTMGDIDASLQATHRMIENAASAGDDEFYSEAYTEA